jgi:hypothetical protein
MVLKEGCVSRCKLAGADQTGCASLLEYAAEARIQDNKGATNHPMVATNVIHQNTAVYIVEL